MAEDKGQLISRRDAVRVTSAGALGAMLGASLIIPAPASAKARALFFDVGGTILDWSAMPDKITKFFADRGVAIDGKTFWIPWRTKLFFYMMYNTMIGSGFIPLEELARRATMALTNICSSTRKRERLPQMRVKPVGTIPVSHWTT